MKTALLFLAILLSSISFSQCEYRYFGSIEYDYLISEKWDTKHSILYRKYYSNKKDTVELHYVDGCNFTQKSNIIEFEDESATFFQSYLKYEDCKMEIGEDGQLVYSRTYILPDDKYDYDLEEVVDTEVKKVTILSDHEDFRTIFGVTFYKEEAVIHHYIF